MSRKKVWVPSNKTEANTNSTNTETSSVDVTNSNTEVSVERPNNTRNQNPNKNQDGTTKPKNRNRNRNKKKILKSEPTGQTDAPTDSTENTTDQINGKQEVGQSTTTKPTGQRKQQDKSRVPKMIRPNQPSFLGAKKQHQQSSQKDSNKSSQLDLSNQSTLAATIIEKLNNNSYECMICTDVIKRQVLVWNCTNCFSLFHLFCIKKWSKTSDDQGNNQKEKPNAPWRCPGCQFIYVNRPQPKCFCGKVKEPSYNGYLLPHSCGEICGKHRLGSDCPHPCNLICHPGHCPPCSAMGPLKTCYCGNLPYRLRCGQKDPGRSCGEVCRKSLNCSKHFCEEICHDGSCPPCQVKEAQQCYCGKSKQTRLCGSGDLDRSSAEPRHYSCGEICNKLLGCGNHTCQRTCHKGPCGDCALLPSKITSCPCGKIPLDLLSNIPRKSCKDEIKTCPNVCGKTLACGKHNCSQTCHLGTCPRCPETVKAPCRCHSTQFTVPCYQANGEASEVLCNKQCKASRICGRHQCGKRCCPSSPLADPYGADISGAHICNLICDRKLKCGKHKCDLLCHSGRCPPCHITMHEQYVCECGFTTMDPPIMCGTKLPDCPKVCVRARPCGHRNNHPCHPRDTPCPPCPVLTEKFCSGGHEASKNVPCNLQIVSCGRTCNKPLSCGVHQCKRICHPDACQSKAECGNLCHRKRDLCDHLCEAPCHGTEPCPKIPCKHLVMVSCPCKRRRVELECLRGGENDSKDNTAPRELLCDEQCEIEARNRRLAEAFGISLGERNTGSMYNDILIQLGKANISLVLRLERRFEELIKGHSTKSLLGSMDRIERRIVHEMAKFYQLDTESFDKEPHRSVTVTKRKDSKIPSLLLSTAISDYQKNGGVTKKETAVPANSTAHPTLYAVHLTDLESRGAATMLTNYLASFAGDYQLKWLSDTSVLVIFSDQSIMKTALHVLAGGPFVVKEWKEKIEIDEPEAKKIKPKVASGPVFKTPDQTWHKDNNFFTALNDMDILNQPVPEKTTKPASVPASFPTGTAWADDFEEEEKTSMLVATTTSPSNKLVEEIPNDLEDDWEVVADKLIEKKEEETN